jgi:hypothetical protein
MPINSLAREVDEEATSNKFLQITLLRTIPNRTQRKAKSIPPEPSERYHL